MGADPSTAWLVASMLGSSALGGLTAPEGQELQSFSGSPGIDPRTLMGESKGLLSDYLDAVLGEAAQPVRMQTTVNPLPSFRGGGLPMAISAPGQDANRLNPELRDTPGFSMARRRLTLPGGAPGERFSTPATDTGRQAQPRSMPWPGDPTGGSGQYHEGANDEDSAMAAIELLLGGRNR